MSLKTKSFFSQINLRLNTLFSAKEKDVIFENLAMLIGAGLEVSLSLGALAKEIRNKHLKAVILQIKEDIQNGSQLWQAFSVSGLFPEYILALIRVGEESGQLNEKLHIIAEQQKKQRILKSRIKSALSYPILIIILTFVVGLGISWFILPRFVSIFKMMNKDLPVLTKGLVASGEFFATYGVLFVPSFALFMVILFYFMFFFSKTRFIGQWLLAHIPVSKRLLQEVELSRFGYNLGTLIQAGLPLITAISAVVNVTTILSYKKFYTFLHDRIEEGWSFSHCFSAYKNSEKLLPASIQQIIVSGEESASLAQSLVDIGNIYETKTDITAKNLTTLLEPILLIIIGLGIMGVALAIISPIYGLMGNLQ